VQAQGELDLQRPLRALPVVAQQRGDAVEALADRVDVHVQCGGRPPGARTRREVRRQRADEVAAAAGVPRTACATTIDEFVREFSAAQQARELTTLVAKVDAIGPAAFVTDLGLLENRFQFQRYLQGR